MAPPPLNGDDRSDPAPVTPPRPLPWPVRVMLLGFALLCLALGVIGIVVPGLPTTVFILMAAWAAARSSPRLYRWLWYHRWFGPMLRDWAQGGRVSRKAKWSATIVMAASATILAVFGPRHWVLGAALACMGCVLAWLWRRPEP